MLFPVFPMFQVASANIKTPSMTIPFLPGISDKEMDNFRISLNRVAMSDVVEAVHVKEKVGIRKRDKLS